MKSNQRPKKHSAFPLLIVVVGAVLAAMVLVVWGGVEYGQGRAGSGCYSSPLSAIWMPGVIEVRIPDLNQAKAWILGNTKFRCAESSGQSTNSTPTSEGSNCPNCPTVQPTPPPVGDDDSSGQNAQDGALLELKCKPENKCEKADPPNVRCWGPFKHDRSLPYVGECEPVKNSLGHVIGWECKVGCKCHVDCVMIKPDTESPLPGTASTEPNPSGLPPEPA